MSGNVKVVGEPTLETLTTQVCTSSQFEERTYERLCAEISQEKLRHRKQWEYVYILRALEQFGKLRVGSRGLGFGCGKEPLAAVMAGRGCNVMCTDIAPPNGGDGYWGSTSVKDFFYGGICAWELFERAVQFRQVNMNNIPSDLGQYDFVWSSCALEHLGSLKHGVDFVKASIKNLKVGGLAVHTTEFNISNSDETLETPELSLYREVDLRQMFCEIEKDGNTVLVPNFNVGSNPVDLYVDLPPYNRDPHIKLLIAEKYIVTSIGFVIQRLV